MLAWVRLLLARPEARRRGRDPLGPRGERLAKRFLRDAGYKALDANVRTSAGEIDLIVEAPDRRTVVFVEVKTRRVGAVRPGGSPPPEASVHARKRAKLVLLAKQISRARGWTDRPLRIDVVAIEAPEVGEPTIRHFVNAVSG
ncbi:MAG: YraN family protein [Phycisphaeraceae bacterium]|nr:YraN family protein [Phycisphaeraceae bacterium]